MRKKIILSVITAIIIVGLMSGLTISRGWDSEQINPLTSEEQTLNEKIDELRQEIAILKDGLELVERDLSYLRAKNLLPQGFLGVELQDIPRGGIVVKKVYAGYPGEQAGLEEGDVILWFGDYRVFSVKALTLYIRITRPGTIVTIGIARRGHLKGLKARIGTRAE